MISILIPTYNYQINTLVQEIHRQSKDLNIDFEIICLDDCSTIPQKDDSFKDLKNTELSYNQLNIGRTETRQLLAKKASFDWILFLDADVQPLNKNFISSYVKAIQHSAFDVCFGGFYYSDQLESNKFSLRWKYGRKKEMINAKERAKDPYKIIISANILLKKALFIDINSQLKGNFYGFDPIFGLHLKKRNATIHHIENPVLHLGLEDNETYLRKKEKAAEVVYHQLIKAKSFNVEGHDLIQAYSTLKTFNLLKVSASLFQFFKPILKKNLLSPSPSIFLLNLYRLGYLTSIKK